MEHQLTVLPLIETVDKVDIELRILGIGNVEGHILPQFVLRRVEDVGTEVEQVTCGLDIRLDSCPSIVIDIAETDLHNKQILVVVSQDSVRVRIVRQILIAESLTDPGHKHIVQVNEIKTITILAILLIPLIMPAGRKNTTMELRTVLRVEEQRHLTAGDDTPTITGT